MCVYLYSSALRFLRAGLYILNIEFGKNIMQVQVRDCIILVK